MSKSRDELAASCRHLAVDVERQFGWGSSDKIVHTLNQAAEYMEVDGRVVVAWDIFEHRIYGSPGETRHRVLWIEHYKRDDGSTPDLDWLLELAKADKLDGAKVIHIRPMYY